MSYQSDYSGAQVDEAVGKALNPDATPTEGSTNLVESGGVASKLTVELLKSGMLSATSPSESYSTNNHGLIIVELYGNATNSLWWAIPAARLASAYGTVVGFPFEIYGSSAIYVKGSIVLSSTSISITNFSSSVWSQVAFRVWGVL